MTACYASPTMLTSVHDHPRPQETCDHWPIGFRPCDLRSILGADNIACVACQSWLVILTRTGGHLCFIWCKRRCGRKARD